LHRLLLIIAFSFLFSSIKAQDKIGLNHRLAPCKKSETPVYYLSYYQSENGYYIVNLFYTDDQPLMVGTSIDSLGQLLDGTSTWYYKNGNIQAEGEYKSGQKQGTWKRYTEDGSPKSDRHYSEVSMDNIVFNSALYMPKPQIESGSFETYIKGYVLEERQFDLIAYSPIVIQLIITNEGIVSDRKYDDRLSMDEMRILDNYINEIPAWKPGSNGTQNINVRVTYSVDLSID
jgi:hypothetical protein